MTDIDNKVSWSDEPARNAASRTWKLYDAEQDGKLAVNDVKTYVWIMDLRLLVITSHLSRQRS